MRNTLLRETISKVINAGDKKVLLNMREVDFVDSSGIGEMVRSHMALHKQGGELKLANLSKVVDDLLRATALNKIFDIHKDEATALSAFGPGKGASAD